MSSDPSAAGASPAAMSETMPLAALARCGPMARLRPDLPPAGAAAAAMLPALLARTLEAAIIPRLALTHRAAAPPPAGAVPAEPEIAALLHHVAGADLAAARALLAALRARDVPFERLMLDLLAPVARRLGEMWLADECDFGTVTVGVCCLQQLVMEQPADAAPLRPPQAERRILLAPVPGEQHGFGLLLVGEMFRRQGWEVCSAAGATAREIVARARRQWFGLVGLSLADAGRLDVLASLIHDIRRASRNPRLGVLVGGVAFAERPDLAPLVGADATAADAQQAVLKAETLLALTLQDA